MKGINLLLNNNVGFQAIKNKPQKEKSTISQRSYLLPKLNSKFGLLYFAGAKKAKKIKKPKTGFNENFAEIKEKLNKLLEQQIITCDEHKKLTEKKFPTAFLLKEDFLFNAIFHKFLSKFISKERKINLSIEDDVIIEHYCYYGTFCEKLNKCLRTKGSLTSAQLTYKKALEKTLDKLPDYKGIVYRKHQFFDKHGILNAGDLYYPKQFLSTTKDFHYLENKEKQYLFVINSKTGKSIGHITSYSNEQEVLFKPDTQFRVTKIKKSKEDKPITYYLEEIEKIT